MATADIIQAEDLNKQSYVDGGCSSVSKIEKQKTILSSITNIPKQEFIIGKKKYSLNESETIREVRIRSLSHWPHFIPSNQSMISAGWFSCNVNDRVICIYCNTICHEWTNNDDPIEVHKRLSPKCPFVISMPLVNNSPKIINNTLEEKFEPSHPTMTEISCREQTFSNAHWTENCPSIESLVRAGFFFTGV
ncbi:unnamed protein product, partial [Rotaria sp. Silwood2]